MSECVCYYNGASKKPGDRSDVRRRGKSEHPLS